MATVLIGRRLLVGVDREQEQNTVAVDEIRWDQVQREDRTFLVALSGQAAPISFGRDSTSLPSASLPVTRGLFDLIHAMLKKAWEQQAEYSEAMLLSFDREIRKIEKEVSRLAYRSAHTDSQSVADALDERVAELERDKLMLEEKRAGISLVTPSRKSSNSRGALLLSQENCGAAGG